MSVLFFCGRDKYIVGAAELCARMSKRQQIVAVIALGMTSTLVVCCGGLTAFGAIVGPQPSKSPAPTRSKVEVVATPAERPETTLTESPSASPSPSPSESPSPSPTAVPTTDPPPPVPTKTTEAAPPPPPPADAYYANCAAVKAAGKAPLYRGQPGYRSGLDRDGDGVACEK